MGASACCGDVGWTENNGLLQQNHCAVSTCVKHAGLGLSQPCMAALNTFSQENVAPAAAGKLEEKTAAASQALCSYGSSQ